jgi:hypothetical protein
MLRRDATMLVSMPPPLPHVLLKLAYDRKVGVMINGPTSLLLVKQSISESGS